MTTNMIVSSQPSSNERMFKTKVVFKVHNFTQLYGKRVVSDVFTVGSDEWEVKVELQDFDNKSYVGVYLLLAKSTDQSIDAQFKTFIVDMNCKSLNDFMSERKAFTVDKGWGTSKYIQYSTLTHKMDDYLPNNTLTVVFNITVWKSIVWLKKRRCFGRSFANKVLNDCPIVVNGHQFFASKLLLSTYTDVFEPMLLTEMKEKVNNEVVINDPNIKPNVFEEFLRFLYFGYSDKLDDMSEQLLYIADKYLVEDLKNICENWIYLQINAKNAFKTLKLMDKYGNKELTAKTNQFIKDNGFEFLKSNCLQKVINDPLIRQVVNQLKDNPKPTETLSYTYLVQ